MPEDNRDLIEVVIGCCNGQMGRDAALEVISELRLAGFEILPIGSAQQPTEPVASVVPCYVPSGKRVALHSKYQDLPIGTELYTTPVQNCSAGTEDALGVIESDRAFAEQILADFGSFEEGITDQEKLAQWIRNVRRAASTPDEPQTVSDCPQRQTAATGGLKVELAARNLRILGLEKSLDEAVVALQGILLHPGDKEPWEDANKVLPSLLRMLDRHEFEEAGFDTCRHCGERKDHNNHIPAPGAPLNKGNAHQRPGIPGSPDAPGKSDRMADGWPSSQAPTYQTLEDAEKHLLANGFKLIPDTCDWIKYTETQTIGAGCYYVDQSEQARTDPFNTKVRIEYEVLEKLDGSSSLTRPHGGGDTA